MTQAVFGRRGAAIALPKTCLPPLERREAASDSLVALRAHGLVVLPDTDVLSNVPFLTFGALALLALVFSLEQHFAFDLGRRGAVSRESLIAFGAISRAALRSGEWWRPFLAPLLHADTMHLASNCIALLFVGWKLEAFVGRGWFAAIFLAGALGGVVGSVTGNPPELISVGASGAIMGLIGALFTMSFRGGADPDRRKRMRRTALRFGLPALLPMALGATGGGVDHCAHLGGFLTGCGLGLLLAAFWPDDECRPSFARPAAHVALAGLVLSCVSGAFAAKHYRAHAQVAAQLIPTALLESAKGGALERSSSLVARYPNDPRSHLLEAMAQMKAKNLAAAEGELRRVVAMVPEAESPYRPAREVATAYLALLLRAQGRVPEASARAAAICGADVQAELKALLKSTKLCM